MTWRVLVTDGEQRSSLATVRSLGRAGHEVHVCATRPRSLSAASRYCASETLVPDSMRDPAGFVNAVAQWASALGADVLLPTTESALLALLPERQRIPSALPFPGAADFWRLCDKAEVLRTAPAHGIAVPEQFVINSADDTGAAHTVTFPVVIKPSRSVVGAPGSRSKTGVMYASDRDELSAILDSLPHAAFPVLLQQRVVGPGTAISVLLWDGQLKAAFAHRRLREKPPSGGVSVLRESIPLDPDLLARSVSLLSAFDWQGVAMVEYKVDRRTGTPFLMEVNGRLWGSLQLAIDAGVDFPDLLVRCAMGETVEPVVDYDTSVRTWWEWGDVDHLVARLLHRSSALSMPEDAPTRLQAIRAFLRTFGSSSRAEIWRREDPRPFLRETAHWLRRR